MILILDTLGKPTYLSGVSREGRTALSLYASIHKLSKNSYRITLCHRFYSRGKVKYQGVKSTTLNQAISIAIVFLKKEQNNALS